MIHWQMMWHKAGKRMNKQPYKQQETGLANMHSHEGYDDGGEGGIGI